MTSYVGRRLLQALVTVWAVLTVSFVMGRASGSPAPILLPPEASQTEINALNEALGFNAPLLIQYGRFLAGAVQGDFGTSYRERGTSALSIAAERLPATFELALTAFVIGLLLAFVAAVAIHVTGSRRLRSTLIWGGSLRHSIPDFFFGLILVIIFSVLLGLLPSLGNRGPASLVMPIATIATGQFVLYVRLIDSALSEQAGADFVRTAYAKGMRHHRVVLTEMLPNALLPVLTVAGLNLGGLMGGTVIVEQVFSWPGLGQVMLNAVSQRDFPIVQAGLLIIALLFVAANFAVDLLYAAIDPRVRLT